MYRFNIHTLSLPLILLVMSMTAFANETVYKKDLLQEHLLQLKKDMVCCDELKSAQNAEFISSYSSCIFIDEDMIPFSSSEEEEGFNSFQCRDFVLPEVNDFYFNVTEVLFYTCFISVTNDPKEVFLPPEPDSFSV